MLTRRVAGRVYNFNQSVSSGVGGGRGFQSPMDFALGSEGSLYVISKGNENMSNHGINKCTLDHRFVWQDRSSTFGGGLVPFPSSIALDSNEDVYIADDYTDRIFIYDKDGNPMGFWPDRETSDADPYLPGRLPLHMYLTKLRGGKNGDGEISGPSGLAFDLQDNLYVVDSQNHRVQKFAKDGKFLLKFGSYGAAEGELNLPWGIALDHEGYVYVADWKNDRVQKFTPEGVHLATFGISGSGEGELHRPTGVAVDDQGDVYVADWGNNRLSIYSAGGEHLTAFYGDANKLSPAQQEGVEANPDAQKARRRADTSVQRPFWRPVAVNVDSEGRIMVLDSHRARIQVYMKEKDWAEAQFNL